MSTLEMPRVLDPFGIQGGSFSSEVTDVAFKDGMYVLTVRICHGYSVKFEGETGSRLYIQYSSANLKDWTLVQ